MVKRWSTFGVIILLATLMAAGWALADEGKAKKDKPARGFVAALKYPGITVSPGTRVRVDLIVENLGRSDETVLFNIKEAPEGWRAEINNFGVVISGMFLTEDQQASPSLVAEVKDKAQAKPGEYRFVVEAASADGKLKQTTSLVVTVTEAEKAGKEVEITTSYPVLRGPTDSKFEFSLELKNNSGKDRLFNLMAQGPQGWDVSFKPAYEQKQISSVQIKSDQSSTVGLVINPARAAAAGTYPIKVQVKSEGVNAEGVFQVVLTGTHKLAAGTPSGLLSLTAQPGQPANMSFYVRNDGSAPQPEVNFINFKPENWEIEFKPEKLTDLKPGELKQVEMIVTPAEQALVGDYSVAVSAQGDKSDTSLEFRVTVKASSAWGWIGVGIIILVLLGLGFTFWKLGRR